MNEPVTYTTIADTQEIVTAVVEDVAKAVGSTMGPNGRLALIAVGTATKVTKDGVTVAKALRFNDPRYELVNKVMVEPAIKTDMECGDGTTTTIILTSILYSVLRANAGYVEQKFIEKLVNRMIEKLSAMSIQIEVDDPRLYRLALTSSNNDEALSQLITDIYAQSGGKFPEIELKEGIESKDKVAKGKGLPLSMQFSNPSFSQSGNGADTAYTDFYPVVVDENIRTYNSQAFFEQMRKLHDRYDKNATIMIIARSIDHDYNAYLAQANAANDPTGQRKRFIGLQTNMGGSVGSLLMQDIASVLGAPLFSRFEDSMTQPLPHVTDEELVVGSNRSLLTHPSAETNKRIRARIESIEKELSAYDMGERFSMRARFNEKRIRNLNGELVTIFVGGETSSEVKERLDRFEDVIKAVKSALVNGILPGVGVSLMKAAYEAINEQGEHGFSPQEEKIAATLYAGMCYPNAILMGSLADRGISISFQTPWVEPEVINLATGETGTPESLGIYDTAFASITALKGGFQTGKILATTSSLLLGDKLSAIKLQS